MLQSRNNSRRQNQAGYSLLMVIFMVATMLIFSSVATQSILTQGRRERETETVWRGEQYRRAIGMYFRKFGKYPTKVEDLVKQTNGVRFLRQAYPEPMNKQDGSWRFIYVGPSGQLVGSLRHTSLLQSVVSTPVLPGASAQPGALTLPGATLSSSPGGSVSSDINTFGQSGQQGQLGQQGQQATSQGFNALGAQPQSLQGAVIGGNIIGVASKMKESSLRVYQGGDTYETWEFIWNPQTQVAIPGQGTTPIAPGAPGAPTAAPGAPGQTIQGGPLTLPPTDQSGGGATLPQNPP